MKKRKPISEGAPQLTTKSLVNESDKGCAIVVGTKLQDLLLELHEVQIAINLRVPEPPKQLLQSLTGVYGPLSNFAGVIQLAYAYGLIGKREYEDLELIRAIRNEAAHSVYEFSFENAGVRAVLARLTWAERFSELDGRYSKDLKVEGFNKDVFEKDMSGLAKLSAARLHLVFAAMGLEAFLLEKRNKLFEQIAGVAGYKQSPV